ASALVNDEHLRTFVDIFKNPDTQASPASPNGGAYITTFNTFIQSWEAGRVPDLAAGLAKLDKEIDDALALGGNSAVTSTAPTGGPPPSPRAAPPRPGAPPGRGGARGVAGVRARFHAGGTPWGQGCLSRAHPRAAGPAGRPTLRLVRSGR